MNKKGIQSKNKVKLFSLKLFVSMPKHNFYLN